MADFSTEMTKIRKQSKIFININEYKREIQKKYYFLKF